ncbi:MAG TPA: hypothetical protein VNL14_04115 [Candidatus Acidoferrales bacterium]|nr:hypothetical protein [Candidatus Acidoferrales bacterium]
MPTTKSFSLDLGFTPINFKTLYLERREELGAEREFSTRAGLRRYFDVLATTSYFDGKLIAEGEFASSMSGKAPQAGEEPHMLRLGVKGRWNGISYGGEYSAIGTGFVSLAGERFNLDRDDARIWAERSFESWRFRGSLGELRQRDRATNELTLTRKGGAAAYFDKGNWSATFSASYLSAARGPNLDVKSSALANALSVAYRPTKILTIVPKVSLTDEWDESTGGRTDTPEASVVLQWNPAGDLQLNGLVSYARAMSKDIFKDNSVVNTRASLNWRIGRPVSAEQFLSLKLEYRNESRFHHPADPLRKLTALISFKIVGF